jgi:hypothetical protein
MWMMALATIYCSLLLGCEKSPEQVCEHTVGVIKADLAQKDKNNKNVLGTTMAMSIIDSFKPMCFEVLTAVKKQRPDAYTQISECAMKSTTPQAFQKCTR